MHGFAAQGLFVFVFFCTRIFCILVELYPALVKNGTIQLFLQLLGHENMDIVAATCNLLQVRAQTSSQNFFICHFRSSPILRL